MQIRIRFMIFFALLTIAHLCSALERPLSLETLAQKSDRIVRGKVVNLFCVPGINEFGDELIYTNASIRVTEALKGDRSDFVITVEGGTLNGITLTVSDAPEFELGEEVLLFVKKDLLTYQPLSGLSSKYRISRDGTVLENGLQYESFRRDIIRTLHVPGSLQ